MYALVLSVTFMAYTIHATPLYPHGTMFGGKNIGNEEVPYLVSILDDSQRPMCSGVAISKRYILTVAHCVQDQTAYYVRNTTGEICPVFWNQNRMIHENFLSSRHGIAANDLALIRLNMDYESIIPVTMFNEKEEVSAGIDASIVGWLKISESYQTQLTVRTVQTLDINVCDKAYGSVDGVPAGHICAAYPGAIGKDGCQGDSGTPLVIGGRLAGILSSGNGCVKLHHPGLYTNVAYYRDWIDEAILKYDKVM